MEVTVSEPCDVIRVGYALKIVYSLKFKMADFTAIIEFNTVETAMSSHPCDKESVLLRLVLLIRGSFA